MIERGDSEDWLDVFKKKYNIKDTNKLFKNENFVNRMGRLLKIAQDGGLLNDIVRRDPRFARIAAKRGVGGYKGLNEFKAVQKAVGEARSQHLSAWTPEVFEDKYVVEAALGEFDRDRWLQINRVVKRGQKAALEGIDAAFSEYKRENAPQKSDEEAWEDYREYIKSATGREGYFKALEDKRVKQTNWREGQSLPPERAVPTPGAAAGIAKVKKEGRKAGGAAPAGRRPGGTPSGRRLSRGNASPKGKKKKKGIK